MYCCLGPKTSETREEKKRGGGVGGEMQNYTHKGVVPIIKNTRGEEGRSRWLMLSHTKGLSL